MSINNVKPVSRCPKCLTKGMVLRKNNELLDMRCQDEECKNEWTTHSLKCKECGNPNGYVVPGPCMECYQLKYRSS